MKGLITGLLPLATCLLLLAASPANAEDVVISGEGQKSVTRYYRIEYDALGVATVSPLKVARPTDAPTPSPTPTPTPGPTLTPFEAEVQRQTQAAIAAGGSKNTAARVSSVYSLVAAAIADGSIPPAQALAAVKLGTDAALAGQADAATWQPWRDAMGGALTKLQQEGSLGTKEQYAAALRSIEKGLNAASGFIGAANVAKIPPGNLGLLDGIDLLKLMEFIKFILELFKLFAPK